MPPDLELLTWNYRGAALLESLNTPVGKAHLGGPESPEKLADRQRRYLTYTQPGETEMLMVSTSGQLVGAVGYWQRETGGYEMGWEIVPAQHGRGIGRRAVTMLIERLVPLRHDQFVFAYPTPDNTGSNALCRTLGFVLMGTLDFEYPKGVWSAHNEWRLDLARWPQQQTIARA